MRIFISPHTKTRALDIRRAKSFNLWWSDYVFQEVLKAKENEWENPEIRKDSDESKVWKALCHWNRLSKCRAANEFCILTTYIQQHWLKSRVDNKCCKFTPQAIWFGSSLQQLFLFLFSSHSSQLFVQPPKNFFCHRITSCLDQQACKSYRPGISFLNMLKGQGHFHFAKGTSIAW